MQEKYSLAKKLTKMFFELWVITDFIANFLKNFSFAITQNIQ